MTNFLVKIFIRNHSEVNDPAVRRQYGLLSGVVGIVLNLLLSAGKLLAGAWTGSIAITADGLNNLSDAGSSIVTLAGFKLAGRRPDRGHPFGHGRMEYLAGLVVALMILLVGVELGKTSIGKILRPEETAFSVLSIGVLAVSILLKLWMYLFNRKLSRQINSATLRASAADSLSDAAATSVVLAGALVGRFTGAAIDGWAGVIVAVFILRAGWGAARDTLDPLLGQRPDPALVENIQGTVLSHPQVLGMHDLIIHDYGPDRSLMSLHAEVSVDADMLETHSVIDCIERELREKFGIETTIHVDPLSNDDRVKQVRGQMLALIQAIEPDMTLHDFRIADGPQNTDLIFDVVVPDKCLLSDEEIHTRITRAVQAVDPSCRVVLQVDRAYVGP